MMLKYSFGMDSEAQNIEDAVTKALDSGLRTADMMAEGCTLCGCEAMGDAVVKLRAGGKLFSGRGISTDIIGASIYAYVNAINKIAYEEKNI